MAYRDFRELEALFPNNATILDAACKMNDHLNNLRYGDEHAMVSISGGSDSDIVLDMVERIGHDCKVTYVWFDTGLEYEATKRHLVYLENKYGITIERHKAKKPVPVSVKEYGVPFISKLDAMYFDRLQKHGFQWEDLPFEELIEKYPNAKSALRWWCNKWSKPNSSFSVTRLSGMKEFVMRNPPPKISDKCCAHAKKNVAYELESAFDVDLSIVGVRQAEGGTRATCCKSCYTPAGAHVAQFRPIFYFTDKDKREYEQFCGIVHSDCYTTYGFKRTGCACCPFGSDFEHELEVVKQYEPKLYKAAVAIFGESYEYTRKYRKFKESWKREKRRGGQIDLFDRWDEL